MKPFWKIKEKLETIAKELSKIKLTPSKLKQKTKNCKEIFNQELGKRCLKSK